MSGITPQTSITIIVEIIANIFNLSIISASIAFVLFVILSGIKLATSLGDPKKIQSARNTLINAFLGFIVIISFFVVIRLLFWIFGFDQTFPNPTAPFQSLIEGLEAFDRLVRK